MSSGEAAERRTQTADTAGVPFRPFFPADLSVRPYSLELLKAYSELRSRPDRPDSMTSGRGQVSDGRDVPQATDRDGETEAKHGIAAADSSGSPPKQTGSSQQDDHKQTSCDSTDQLTREFSPSPGKPGGGGGGGGEGAGQPVTPGGGAAGQQAAGQQDPAGIRRYRTAFRPDQIKRLEAEFLKDNYVSRPKRNELANELGLPEGTIKVWFQNRRMKHKRQQMTAWPLDPRFTDPALAAMILQAAVASGTYSPYHPHHHPHPHLSPYYTGPLSPVAAAAAATAGGKCRYSPYSPVPVRPQPGLPPPAGLLLHPLEVLRPPSGTLPPGPGALHSPLFGGSGAPPPGSLADLTPAGRQIFPTTSSPSTGTTTAEPSHLFRPFKSDSPVKQVN